MAQITRLPKNHRSAINGIHGGEGKQRSIQIITVRCQTNLIHKETTQKEGHNKSVITLDYSQTYREGINTKKNSDAVTDNSASNKNDLILYSPDQKDIGITTEYKI